MGKTILVVDDSAVFRGLEQSLLQEAGYTLLQAGDGAKAVSLAAEQSPDLIVLDLQMPVLDGVQTLKILKKSAKTRHIPVIIVSAEGATKAAEALLAQGAHAVLTKPLKSEALVNAARAALHD
jgi:CheY-like chemotaxis protein